MTHSEKRILVVDDEISVCNMLEYGLSHAGFVVRSSPDGRRGLDIVSEWNPHAVILDVMLPEIDGMTLLPKFRNVTDAPIILLSAKTAVTDKVVGLSRGADDYVAKPFDMEELIARIHSALRRPRLDVRHTLTYADLTVEMGSRIVFRRERRIELSKREFDLLLTFLREPGKVFTRSQLLDLVWGMDRDIVPNIVETYISYLRAKIDHEESTKLIRTIRGVGYMVSDERP